MIINEAKLKEYIRKVLMETFYAHPDYPGQPMTKDQLLKMDPDFFTTKSKVYDPNSWLMVDKLPPENIEGVSKDYPHRLAKQAKKEYQDLDPATLTLIKQKVGITTFGIKFGTDFLDMLHFDPRDIDIHAPEIADHKEKENENYEQGLMLISSFLPSLAEYIEALADYTGFKVTDPDKVMRLDPSTPQSFVDKTDAIYRFFFIPNKGKIGMGASLLDDITKKIMSSLVTINNITPIEFAETHYPEFERYINAAFKLAFKDQPEIDFFERAKKAYLESIYYVLREFIAEANFEGAYLKFGDGSPSPQPTSSNYNELMFLPTDPQQLKILDAASKQLKYDRNSNVDIAQLIRSPHFLSTSELRSLPSYYDMKFTYNPNYGSNAATNAENTFDWRISMNLSFGVGFRKEGIPVYYGNDPVGERWEKT